MAIKVRNTSKPVEITEKCFGENVTVKTKKKCVGNPVLEEKKCQVCIGHKTSLVPLVCLVKAGMGKVSKKKKSNPVKKEKSVVEHTVEQFFNGVTDTKSLHDIISPLFPERNVKSTISSALSVLKHVHKYA